MPGESPPDVRIPIVLILPIVFLFIFHERLDAVGNVLFEVVEEEAVVVQMVALGAEHGGAVGWGWRRALFGR